MVRLNANGRIWVAADKWELGDIRDRDKIKRRLDYRGEDNPLKSGLIIRDGYKLKAAYSQSFDDIEKEYSISALLSDVIQPNCIIANKIEGRFYIAIISDGMPLFDIILDEPKIGLRQKIQITLAINKLLKQLSNDSQLYICGEVDVVDGELDIFNSDMYSTVKQDDIPSKSFAQRNIKTQQFDINELLDVDEATAERYRMYDFELIQIPRLKRYKIVSVIIILLFLLVYLWPENEAKNTNVNQPVVYINDYLKYIDLLTNEGVNFKRRIEHEVVLINNISSINGWGLQKLIANQTNTLLVMEPTDHSIDTANIRVETSNMGFGAFEMNNDGAYLTQRTIDNDVSVMNIKDVYNKDEDYVLVPHLSSIQQAIVAGLQLFWDKQQYQVNTKPLDANEMPKGIPADINALKITIEFKGMDHHDLDSIASMYISYPLLFEKLTLEPIKNELYPMFNGKIELIALGN